MKIPPIQEYIIFVSTLLTNEPHRRQSITAINQLLWIYHFHIDENAILFQPNECLQVVNNKFEIQYASFSPLQESWMTQNFPLLHPKFLSHKP